MNPEPFDSLLGYHLRRLSALVMADFAAALAPLGLKPADASILFLLGAHAGLTQAEIGRILGIQRANMAPLIAALMKRNLIAREPVNGRAQALELTPTGRAMHAEAGARTRAHENRLFGALPEIDKTRIIEQLKSLWQTLAIDA